MLNFYLYSVTSISLAAFYFAAVYLVSGALLSAWMGAGPVWWRVGRGRR